MKSLFIRFLVLTVVGCASGGAEAGFNSYIGRPVSDLAMRIGPPTFVSPGPKGWPIFRWRNFGPSGQTIGAETVVEVILIHNWRCILVVGSRPAKNNPTSAMVDWLIENWRFVGWGCI